VAAQMDTVSLTKFRKDGWPLCPICDEDELWSPLEWGHNNEPVPSLGEFMAAGLRCYRCNWKLLGRLVF
jgi:hypothetical protein